MSLDLTKFAAMLKQLYPDSKSIKNVAMNKHPLLEMVKKDPKAAGSEVKQPLIYGNQATTTASFSQVATNAASNNTLSVAFFLPMMDLFNMTYISDKAIQASRNDAGAFTRALKFQVDGMLSDIKAQIALQLYRSGWGELGQVSSPGASTTLTLVDKYDALNFSVGNTIVFASGIDSGALRDSGASLNVTGVNYNNGTLTVSANVNSISGITNGDYIFIKGTRQDAATPAKLLLTGLAGWNPVTAPASNDSFFGVNRSVSSLLYGSVVDGSAKPIQQALVEGVAQVMAIRGEIDHYLMNPIKFQELVNSLSSQVQFVNITDAKGAPVGFQGITIACGGKPVKIVPDSDCPYNRAYGVKLDTLVLWSMGEIASIYDRDGNVALRVANDNSVEVRSYNYLQFCNTAPAWAVVVTF